MKTLQKEENQLSEAAYQVKTLENTSEIKFSEKPSPFSLCNTGIKVTSPQVITLNLISFTLT